jgi:hypothetical protein
LREEKEAAKHVGNINMYISRALSAPQPKPKESSESKRRKQNKTPTKCDSTSNEEKITFIQ